MESVYENRERERERLSTFGVREYDLSFHRPMVVLSRKLTIGCLHGNPW